MQRPLLGACAQLIAPIHAQILPSAETVSNEGLKLIRGRYMAKVILLCNKSLTNLQSLAMLAHLRLQLYTHVACAGRCCSAHGRQCKAKQALSPGTHMNWAWHHRGSRGSACCFLATGPVTGCQLQGASCSVHGAHTFGWGTCYDDDLFGVLPHYQ